MLELKNITKVYEAGTTQVEALKGIDIAFRESEFVAILGQSGCGKNATRYPSASNVRAMTTPPKDG